MSGSSASGASFLSAGLSGGGTEISTGFGAGDSTRGSGCCSGGGGGDGGGSVATAGPDGRGPPVPGINEKSSAREDEIQGTCSPREARVTPTRVRLSVSSAIRSGTRTSFNSSCTNRPPLSEITEESAAEYITSVPLGAITGAKPAEKLRNRRSNGLRRGASVRAVLTPAPPLLISPPTLSPPHPPPRTSRSSPL